MHFQCIVVEFFSPHIVRRNLIERNILYVVNKKQSDIFNNLISQHLEPSLLEKATNILSKIPGLTIKNNINWSTKDCCGEFDIAGYHPDSNIFLHVQAKAALPPQGARMTKAIERRSEEGIKQLERFYNLSEESKNTILSSRFNYKIENPQVINILLSYSGFGTHSVWKKLDTVCFLNLTFLNGVVNQIVENNLSLIEFRNVYLTLFDKIISQVFKEWSHENIELNGTKIYFPVLQLDNQKLMKIILDIHRHGTINF